MFIGYSDGFNATQVGSAPVSGYCEGGTSTSFYTARLSTGDAATLNNGDVEDDLNISGTMMFYST